MADNIILKLTVSSIILTKYAECNHPIAMIVKTQKQQQAAYGWCYVLSFIKLWCLSDYDGILL